MTRFAMLDVFSGLPNPVWRLDDDFSSQVLESASGLVTPEPPQVLGYRGFKIIESDFEPELVATTAEAIGSFSELGLVIGESGLEQTLLDAGRDAGAIDQDLYEFVTGYAGTVPDSSAGTEAFGPSCPPCGGADAPSYNPSYWNSPSRQPYNNCYNYANDQATDTFAQPGRGSGQQFAWIDCDEVRAAAQRDGLVPTNTFEASRAGWYVALVIWPGQDYHWYRQDDVGCWSHKPGQTRARNVDNSGSAIADPKSCDRGPYSIFCTYMVTDAGVTIR